MANILEFGYFAGTLAGHVADIRNVAGAVLGDGDGLAITEIAPGRFQVEYEGNDTGHHTLHIRVSTDQIVGPLHYNMPGGGSVIWEQPPWVASLAADIAEVLHEIQEHDTGAGKGARTVLVTVTDGSNPLENATIRFTEGVNNYIVPTNANGERVFALDDATWSYAVTKPGYIGVTGAHVVNSSETPLNIELVLNAITPPDAPELCRVSLDLYKNSIPVSGATFEARFVDINQAINNIVLSKQIDTDLTDSNGHADLDLIRLDQFTLGDGDGLYQIRVIHPDKTVSLDIKTTIPNQSNVNVQDLIP